jgi:precorrin-8X methylmutase
MYITNPSEIEKKSFEIIDEIIKSEHKGYEFKSSFEEKIIKRCVHTSADFDYLYNLKISENFEEIIKKAIEEKATIYTDTTMALSGINKTSLKKYGMEVRCLIADEETKLLAEKMKITRSMASVIRIFEDKNPKIAVVGNAPTFLYKTLEMYEEDKSSLRAIIGAPVGFVEAKESKDKLFETNIPQVVALGRKGGSNIAAAIVNAILYALV